MAASNPRQTQRHAKPTPIASLLSAFGPLIGLALLVLMGLAAWWLTQRPKAPPLGFALDKVEFKALPGWADDDLAAALIPLQRSCAVLIKRPKTARIGPDWAGSAGDWLPACASILALPLDAADTQIRTVIKQHLTPYAVSVGATRDGTFTGYYENQLSGSLTPSKRYRYPLYQRPSDLVEVNLGSFRPSLKGERIAGRVQGNRLVPYADRADIDRGAIHGQTDVIVWVDSAVDAFFLHIQGSGRVEMDDGSLLRVGYAGQNGHSYVAIGRVLVEMGEIARKDVSMQSIRAWLEANPDRVEALLHENPSYVFFRPLKNAPPADGGSAAPFGSSGLALTPQRSLAADLRFLPHHMPVFLSTTHPRPNGLEQLPFQKLMVVQDRGGAIRGEIRGDVFWGHGEQAAEIAGRMANKGRYWVLLPKGLSETRAVQVMPDAR